MRLPPVLLRALRDPPLSQPRAAVEQECCAQRAPGCRGGHVLIELRHNTATGEDAAGGATAGRPPVLRHAPRRAAPCLREVECGVECECECEAERKVECKVEVRSEGDNEVGGEAR